MFSNALSKHFYVSTVLVTFAMADFKTIGVIVIHAVIPNINKELRSQ